MNRGVHSQVGLRTTGRIGREEESPTSLQFVATVATSNGEFFARISSDFRRD